jgi:hypothetical protein
MQHRPPQHPDASQLKVLTRPAPFLSGADTPQPAGLGRPWRGQQAHSSVFFRAGSGMLCWPGHVNGPPRRPVEPRADPPPRSNLGLLFRLGRFCVQLLQDQADHGPLLGADLRRAMECLNVPDLAYQECFLPSRQSWIAAVPLEDGAGRPTAPSVPAVPVGSVLAIASPADTRSLAWALPPSRATISQATCGRHYARASRVADAAGQVETINGAVRICCLRQRGTLADISSFKLVWDNRRTAPLCLRARC